MALNGLFSYCNLTLAVSFSIAFSLLLAAVEGGSLAEWLTCWTRAQKGPGSNCSRDAVG